MVDQIKILTLMFALFWAVGVIGFIYQRTRFYNTLYLKFILKYSIITTIIIFIFFISKYFEINIWQEDINLNRAEYLPLLFSIIYLSLFLLIFTMYEIFKAFRNEIISKRKRILVYFVILSLVLLVYISSDFAANNRDYFWIWLIFDNLGIIFPLFEIVILIRLFYYSKSKDPPKRIIKSFSLIYLLRYPFLVLSMMLPEPIRLSGLILLIHLLTVIWIKNYVDNFEQVRNKTKNIDEQIIRLSLKHNISAREKEILLLIIEGKNNKQIGDTLFISYHTVKNHIYNLFKKLNINNRYQLMNLIKTKYDL